MIPKGFKTVLSGYDIKGVVHPINNLNNLHEFKASWGDQSFYG